MSAEGARSAGPGAAGRPVAVAPALHALPSRLRHEPAWSAVAGRADASLAVPPPAQAFVLAGLAELSVRRPLLVVTATGADAERLATDLSCFVAPDGDPAARWWATCGNRWWCCRRGRRCPSSG